MRIWRKVPVVTSPLDRIQLHLPIKPPPPLHDLVQPTHPRPLLLAPTPDPPAPMTITLELEPPVVRHSAVNGKETIINVRSTAPPPQTTQSTQPLSSSSAKSTNLLQNFIEAFKEVESYRYVRRDRGSCSGTC